MRPRSNHARQVAAHQSKRLAILERIEDLERKTGEHVVAKADATLAAKQLQAQIKVARSEPGHEQAAAERKAAWAARKEREAAKEKLRLKELEAARVAEEATAKQEEAAAATPMAIGDGASAGRFCVRFAIVALAADRVTAQCVVD